ncbi:MAG: nicotinamide-nucleotide amidohydrolase family protein, partial [Bacteroidetes bacterium]|nr:nicotinamide-nucleotide amidohydrolase family protein [Bacteroidota bacterium]
FTVTKKNCKQAEVPESCTVIPNKQGTAPGMWFVQNGKIFISIPGVPFEMKAMITDYIIPMLKSRAGNNAIVHKTILTQGIGESFLADLIADWENNLPENVHLAYLPSPGLVRLRLTAKGTDKDALINIIDNEIEKLQKIIPEYIYGFDTEALEQIIGDLLIKKGKTLVTAESCTGGYIAHCITKVPGCSAYFKGSVIAYSNETKENILDVKHETLVEYGAVSEETVKEMAENARKKLEADYSIAVSGIAGPDGGSAEKPVGLVYIGVASADSVIVQKFNFGNNRMINIERATVFALNMLRKEILNK